MPEPTFRGDPYAVLDVDSEATPSQIKRRWRELAREHHPDRASDPTEAGRLTGRMARINAAYDLLRDPVRRARYDASPAAQRARDGAGAERRRTRFEQAEDAARGGPPPPPPTRPVTARFDTSAVFHGRNTVTSRGPTPLAGHPPIERRTRDGGPDLRASTPTGPVERRASEAPPRMPTLEEARSTVLEFGKFRGFSLGEIAEMEPTYIDWIGQTITRDRDLVLRARVIAADLDRRGVSRRARPQRPGFGAPADEQPEPAAAR